MDTKEILTPGLPARYRLRLQGRVTVGWLDWLADAAVHYDFSNSVIVTVVIGTVRDQSALFGLLSFVRNLGVPLISVEAIPSPGGPPPGNPNSPQGEMP
jgi:hypothetical protein